VQRCAGALADVRPDLSDRHGGGQTVLECILATGERVVYKPRAVAAEAAFFRFVRWLNDQDLSTRLLDVRVLDRGTHGWIEWVAPAACRAERDVEVFYRRSGMLLALLDLLAVSDVHCDNLIASADEPVVVDLETLLSERPATGRGSVQDTGMLPASRESPDGHELDLSALGADAVHRAGLRFPSWRAVNTDQMSLAEDDGAAVASGHRVRLAGRAPSIGEHLETFLEGFREAYFCLMHNAREIERHPELLDCLDRIESRVLVRDTSTYAALQLHLLHPEFLGDGIDRSIELEWLARPITAPDVLAAGRLRLYARERDQMESLDIPRFTSADWQQLAIPGDDEDLALVCGERDSGVVRRRLASLSAADFERQRAIAERAVRSRFSCGPAASAP
jgi:lantibiotic modifying enzyme